MREFIRILGLAVLVLGIILLIFGVRATDEFGQKVTQSMTGSYSEGTRWDIIGGSIAIVIGSLVLSFSGRFRR